MKKRWHKVLALTLAAALCLGAVGCGKDEGTTEEQQVTTETEGTEGQENTENQENKEDAAADQAEGEGEKAEGAKEPETDGATTETEGTAAATPTTLQEVWLQADGAPTITAESALLIDQESGTILYEKNAKEKIYPASVTKIITALVVMDYLQPDEIITVGTEINEVTLDSSKAGHVLNEKLTVENALRGLLMPSGNDSANVLAAATARKAENDQDMSFAKCEAVFTDLMNKKAEELGAVNSHFTNAHGYHDENHYSCAYDMALFTMAFMQNETLAEIVSEKSFSGNGADGQFADDPEVITQDYNWVSHNYLITDNEYQYAYATGIKTGFTDEAGECLAASAEKGDMKLISLLFKGSDPARWTESASLLEYGFNNYARVELTAAGAAIEEVPLTKHNKLQGDTVPLVYQNALVTYLPTNAVDSVETTVTILDDYKVEEKDGTVKVKAPLTKGEKIATVTYTIDGKEVAQMPAYAGADIEKGTIFNNIWYGLKTFFSHLFSLKGLITVVVIVVILTIIYLILKRMRYGGGYRLRGGYTLKSPSRRRGRRRW